jgi:hypothetical protein
MRRRPASCPARKDSARVKLYSRPGNDLTDRSRRSPTSPLKRGVVPPLHGYDPLEGHMANPYRAAGIDRWPDDICGIHGFGL